MRFARMPRVCVKRGWFWVTTPACFCAHFTPELSLALSSDSLRQPDASQRT